ncbi:uncharacterized protein LOC141611835 isoform X1 [Silene latifolia]|uniref:uncharacterized protein LOC141611835 isoform X1 n=1 Tax=Silene latifolia TaxID=37657 RepID=UPI003D77D08E
MKTSNLLRLLAILFCSSILLLFLASLTMVWTTSNCTNFLASSRYFTPVSIEHVVFGIASTGKTWPKQKEFLQLWWKPDKMEGCVFVDALPPNPSNSSVDTTLPPICVSQDTSHFRYTYKHGYRSLIRVARVVSETVNLDYPDAKWYVFGDGDTVFFPDNLVKTLSKYDHELWYYVGANSEIYEQNAVNSFEMAFWGAGFAVSAPLAKVLARVFDSCLERYPHLYGGDGRVYACLAELGVGLTHEPGFHQVRFGFHVYRLPLVLKCDSFISFLQVMYTSSLWYEYPLHFWNEHFSRTQMDIRGNIFGLLAAHPLAPLISLPRLSEVDPIFPEKTTINALQHLFESVSMDSERILQQTVCYDRWFSWTVSVSWGYAVEVFDHHIYLSDILRRQDTFSPWKKGSEVRYSFSTRPLHPDPCRRSTIFFFDRIYARKMKIISNYRRMIPDNCTFDPMGSPKKLQEIIVYSQKSSLGMNQLKAPRRQCCDVLPSSVGQKLELQIRECGEDELIRIHA